MRILGSPPAWLIPMSGSAQPTIRGGSLNFAGMDDPQVNAKIENQRTIFDEKQRKAVVRDLVLYLIDHAPSTFGVNLFWLDATQPKVQNHQPQNTLNGRQYQQVWFDS